MEQAEDLCDQVLLVHKGEKVLDETMNQIHGRFDPRTILAEPSNSIEAATQALQNVADIESFRWSVEQKAFEIRVAQGVDTQLAMASVMRATPLRRVELQRATLDDVFVTLVGGSVGEIESAQNLESCRQLMIDRGAARRIRAIAWRDFRYTALTKVFNRRNHFARSHVRRHSPFAHVDRLDISTA